MSNERSKTDHVPYLFLYSSSRVLRPDDDQRETDGSCLGLDRAHGEKERNVDQKKSPEVRSATCRVVLA